MPSSDQLVLGRGTDPREKRLLLSPSAPDPNTALARTPACAWPENPTSKPL